MKVSRYLSIGNACNLRCKFCYNDLNREEKTFFEPLKNVCEKVDEIRKEYDYITIVGGEPFMYPDILKLLGYIKKKNFNNIWIVTNGIRLADINFAIKLYYLGVNALEFSIHASDQKGEKDITDRSGVNLDKREQGIKNIVILNKKFSNKIELYSNTVINKINYKNIGNIINYIGGIGIQNLSLSFMYNLKGLSKTNKELFIQYSSVIEVFNTMKLKCNTLNIEIDWLPYCLHKAIKGFDYKIRELKSCERHKLDYKYIDSKIKYKVKSDQCKRCSAYGKYCNGIFKDYISIYGDTEFKAL